MLSRTYGKCRKLLREALRNGKGIVGKPNQMARRDGEIETCIAMGRRMVNIGSQMVSAGGLKMSAKAMLLN